MADRGLRRVLKRPRHVRSWPLAAYGLIAVLVAIVIIAAVGCVVFLPKELPPSSTASGDRWVAEGAIVGAGAFLLAVLATAIATVAYINSTEKPSLRLEAHYPGHDQAAELAREGLSIPDWSLQLRLYNDGPVAARQVAVRVTFSKGVSLSTPANAITLAPWYTASPEDKNPSQLWWEGGADAVVHPSPTWPYQLPQLGRAPLGLTPSPASFTVEVVADDVAPFQRTLRLF
jgi:hypothetical protein